ncbi:hypothetical protein CYY_004254 [Polysphondylium violaceum]|uniref:Uncharacterized protein n=1 Tax=Polysphondylium violaceum TaxID=133409 RepID=A0A8J4PVP9_9MYCE|nr:hypothetical protein CYY_004254 [Polysphondylium violaceum]
MIATTTTNSNSSNSNSNNNLYFNIYRNEYLRKQIYQHFGLEFRKDYDLCYGNNIFEQYDDMSLVSIIRTKNRYLIQEKLGLYRRVMTNQQLPSNKQRSNSFYQDILDIPRDLSIFYQIPLDIVTDTMFMDICFLHITNQRDVYHLFYYFPITRARVLMLEEQHTSALGKIACNTDMKFDGIDTVKWLFEQGQLTFGKNKAREFFNSTLFLDNYKTFAEFNWPATDLVPLLICNLGHPNRIEFLKVTLESSNHFNPLLASKDPKSRLKSLVGIKDPIFSLYGVDIVARKEDSKLFTLHHCDNLTVELWSFIKKAYPSISGLVSSKATGASFDLQTAKEFLETIGIRTSGLDPGRIMYLCEYTLNPKATHNLNSSQVIQQHIKYCPELFLKCNLLDNPLIPNVVEFYRSLFQEADMDIPSESFYKCPTFIDAIVQNRMDVVLGFYNLCNRVDISLLVQVYGNREMFEFFWEEYSASRTDLVDACGCLCDCALLNYDFTDFKRFFDILGADQQAHQASILKRSFKESYSQLSRARNSKQKKGCLQILEFCKGALKQTDGPAFIENEFPKLNAQLVKIQDPQLRAQFPVQNQDKFKILATSLKLNSMPLARYATDGLLLNENDKNQISKIVLDYFREFKSSHLKVPLFLIEKYQHTFQPYFVDKMLTIAVKANNYRLLHILLNKTNIRLLKTADKESEQKLLEKTFMNIKKSSHIKQTDYFKVFPAEDIVDLSSKTFKQHGFDDSHKHMTLPSRTQFKEYNLPFECPYKVASWFDSV